MRAPSHRSMIDIWEAGQDIAPWARALLLLRAAQPDMDTAALESLPVGERDARLIDLRALIFGNSLSSLARCPECGEQLELSFSVQDVQVDGPPDTTGFSLRRDGWVIGYRLPSTADFRSLSVGPDAPRALLAACIGGISRHGKDVPFADLDAETIDMVVADMAEADPRADLKAAMRCPSCAAQWSARFDIVAYLWEELGAWVRRLLADVHVLARHYGWREDDVLALSPWRRQHYIGLVRS